MVASDSQRNIVLVSVDSLRADHCGFLGDDSGLTPAMDDLAAEGVTFEAAVAPGPQTFSSMPAAFTGRRRPAGDVEAAPGDTHWERRLAAIDDHLDRHGTLPERLRARGYTTAGISPNPWTSPAAGFDRGFDTFVDLAGETSGGGWLHDLVERIPWFDPSDKSVELALDLLTGSSFFTRWEGMYDEIMAARDRLEEPYFLWVFLLDTHYPFVPTRTHRREQSLPGMVSSALRSEKAMRGHADGMPDAVRASMERSYRDSVRSVDAFVDQLRGDLAADDPAIVLHSDHGESFGEHGNWGHHHRELYRENVHVPYVVHDGRTEATVDRPTSLATIPSVTLSLATEGTVDPDVVGERSAVATSEGGGNRAVRDRTFTYIEHGDHRDLYAVEDPHERTDLSEDYPGRCGWCRSRLDRFERHHGEVDGIARAARRLAAEGSLS